MDRVEPTPPDTGSAPSSSTLQGRIEHWSARLPWVGGCLLAGLASAVNVHFLARVGLSVSHLTGDLARLGIRAGSAPWEVPRGALPLVGVLTAFVLGAVLSGVFVQRPALTLDRPYGRAVASTGAMLLVAWGLEGHSLALSSSLAAAACGFQNGLATHHRGLILRTTHVTGVLTDIGHMLGMKLSGRSVESWKIGVQVLIVLSFFFGAVAGAILEAYQGTSALAVIGCAYVVMGVGWSLIKRRALGITAAPR